MSAGLALAGATAVGSAACEFGRKRLTKGGLDAATIVSLVCLLVGLAGLTGLTIVTGSLPCPVASFWPPALASAGLSAVTATLLTKAYSNNDISLVAPFNSALPVFQFFVTTFLLQDESQLPARKVFGVFVVCACSFWLARSGRAPGATSAPLLPPGALHVLLCCAIWSVVTKFDQLATKAAGSPVIYVCWAKLLTGLWAAGGSILPALLSSRRALPLSQLSTTAPSSLHRRATSPSRVGASVATARKSPRRTAGPPMRLGANDSWGTGADRRWASSAVGTPLAEVSGASELATDKKAAAPSTPSAQGWAQSKECRGRNSYERTLRLLWTEPKFALLLCTIALVEGGYMGCYFAALTRTSKVYVVAIKKGGNLLVSSVGGWVFLGESTEGRVLPVMGVVLGVVLMSI